jgi:hypothetical protein
VRTEVENVLSDIQTKMNPEFETSQIPIMALNIKSRGKAVNNYAQSLTPSMLKISYLDQRQAHATHCREH